MIFAIAFRTIRRNKRRTILSSITIAISILFFTFMDSILSGFDRGAIDNMIELSTSALTLQTEKYYQERRSFPLDYDIPELHALQREVMHMNTILASAPRTRFLAQLSNYTNTIPVLGIVVDPGQDSLVFSLSKHLKGRYFSQTNTREIIVGSTLAKEMNLQLGDAVTLIALTRFSTHTADEFTLIGLLNTTDPNINKSHVMISYAAANDFLDLQNLTTEFNLSIQRPANLKVLSNKIISIQRQLEKKFPALKVTTFLEEGAALLEVSKQKRYFGVILLIIILLIAGVGVFNTVLMSVYERIREIGILRALGMRPRAIMLLFTIEGFLTGVSGSILGCMISVPVNWLVVTVGYSIEKLAGNLDTTGIPVWGTIYGEWAFYALIFSMVFCICMTTVAGLIPAYHASKLQVTRALRFV